jgi:D-beta-D-heptose 7-phosphate kinase/D-beta-D-heptose 1-phosphate adenosyltransferase
MGRLLGIRELLRIRRSLRRRGKTVVFTNGVFDIIHRGHVEYLAKARALGDVLVVGLNTDASIRRIKGRNRPINPGTDRAAVLSMLSPVDYVCFFREDTPRRLIARLLPDVLVKGADWKRNSIVGKEIVEGNGGIVKTVRLTPRRSTTSIIARVWKARRHPARSGRPPYRRRPGPA